jgi:hypothetical protein
VAVGEDGVGDGASDALHALRTATRFFRTRLLLFFEGWSAFARPTGCIDFVSLIRVLFRRPRVR